MKVTDETLKSNEDLLKRMNRGLEKKIANKEVEIQKVGEMYDKKIELAKIEGEDQYIQSLEKNQQRIVGDSKQFEDKIQSYRDQLAKVQQTVENEKGILKNNHKTNLDSMKTQLDDNFQEQMTNSIEGQREIVSSTQNSVKELATRSKSEKLTAENQAQYEINALTAGFDQKAISTEKEFRNQMENDVRMHTLELTRQRDDLKKIMSTDTEKHKRLEQETVRIQKDQLSYLDKHQQSMIKQRQDDFKVRYEKMVAEHDKILKDLSQHFTADVKKMAEQTASEKVILGKRVDDQFYRIDKLNATMVDAPKEVIVKVPVPEYEKENVHLSTQGRNIKITLARKFSDNITSIEGNIDRSTRSELYSKELNTIDLLSPKNIVQNYQDGVLTFKIPKA
jgi:HSP20 family molecular chaperone IbpA